MTCLCNKSKKHLRKTNRLEGSIAGMVFVRKFYLDEVPYESNKKTR